MYIFLLDPREIREVREEVMVKVCGVHRLSKEWKYDEYFIEAQLFHGSRCVSRKEHSKTVKVVDSLRFYPKAVFNIW